jgi:hypothetical protein
MLLLSSVEGTKLELDSKLEDDGVARTKNDPFKDFKLS